MRLLRGDCREVLRTLADNSVDAVVCDPPYELGFMGKKWDSTGIAYDVTVWQECLRVLKPGGRLLAFGGTRTYHRLACAIEDAGFAIADQLQWLYGSGFPKSLDISKAIDKAAGAEREVTRHHTQSATRPNEHAGASAHITMPNNWDITAPATPEAQQWDGWGTALKPMHEPVCFAIKPLDGTYAANVLKWGCGGLNIDGCRIGTDGRPLREKTGERWQASNMESCGSKAVGDTILGRWPGNVLLDPEAAAMLDEQSGELTSGARQGGEPYKLGRFEGQSGRRGLKVGGACEASRGGASRFFYCAKVARWERDFGLDGFEVKQTVGGGGITACGDKYGSIKAPSGNHHPTLKPVSLLRWLCRLVTPPGGVILDPFMGSGSCGIAAKLEGFDYIGIELEPEYYAIAKARIAAWQVGSKQDAKTKPDRAKPITYPLARYSSTSIWDNGNINKPNPREPQPEPKPETQMPLPLAQ